LLRDLTYTTDTSGQYYYTRLKADVYRKNEGRNYRKLISVDTLLSGRLTNPDGYTVGITAVLDELYRTSLTVVYQAEKPENRLSATEAVNGLTETAIGAQAAAGTALPVLSSKSFVNGAYATFQEFLRNTPSITGPLWAEPDTLAGNGHAKVFVLGEDSTARQLTNIWGVCFGGAELYKYENGQLIPIEKSGNGFILSRFQDPVIRRNQALYWRRVASYGWPDDTNPFSRQRVLTVQQPDVVAKFISKQLPVATRIDMSTGALTF
jgi:hypothetical protein